MKSFAFICLENKECQACAYIYGGMKSGVELSFLLQLVNNEPEITDVT